MNLTPDNPITAEEIDDLIPLVIEIPADECEDDSILLVQGRNISFPFGKKALATHEPTIRALLNRVAPEFKEIAGGGACLTNWPWLDSPLGAVRHEALLALGLAIGKVQWLAPRESWGEIFPDGNPYLVVRAEPGEVVPPKPPLYPTVPQFSNLVPWVKNTGRRLYSGAKKIVKIKVRHQKPKNR
jgi:hypothetical protein